MRAKYKNVLILALLVGILPPAWAVLSGHVRVSVGAVALITAAIYGADQNQLKDAPKISLGLLAGDLWAYLSCSLIARSPLNADVTVFLVLFLFGIAAVILASLAERYIFLPGWLGGWAIGMTVLDLSGSTNTLSMVVQIGISMLVGIWYVGALLNGIFQKLTA